MKYYYVVFMFEDGHTEGRVSNVEEWMKPNVGDVLSFISYLKNGAAIYDNTTEVISWQEIEQ